MGSLLKVKVNQAGNDPSLIFAQFTGSQPQNVIITPDSSSWLSFQWARKAVTSPSLPPARLQPGSIHNIYPSAISPTANGTPPFGSEELRASPLAQAIGFAMGTMSPTLDQASNGISTFNTIPPNYGAPWKLGASLYKYHHRHFRGRRHHTNYHLYGRHILPATLSSWPTTTISVAPMAR